MFKNSKKIEDLEQQVKTLRIEVARLKNKIKMRETIERMEKDGTAEQIGKFNKAAFEILDGVSEPDKIYEFTCPACGGKAHTYKSSENGHFHADCSNCSLGFHQ